MIGGAAEKHEAACRFVRGANFSRWVATAITVARVSLFIVNDGKVTHGAASTCIHYGGHFCAARYRSYEAFVDGVIEDWRDTFEGNFTSAVFWRWHEVYRHDTLG